MTHTQLWGSNHPSLSQVIGSSHLSIYILFFPWWVTVFHLLLISFWFIIWFIILFWDGTFWNISLTHWWAIAYRSQKCCLIILDSLLYIKRLSCLRESRFRITLSSVFVSKVLTVLVIASGFVITSHQDLNHFDYIIRVCPYYIIKSYFSIRSQRIRLFFGKYVEYY